MQNPNAEKADSIRKQTVLAKFGELALRSTDADEILMEACRLVEQGLGADLAKVVELQSDGHTLLVRAGVGWKPGVVGQITIEAGDDTSEGHALMTGQPMISPDIASEQRFRYAPFLIDNGVKAIANVPIIGGNGKRPFGILQVDSRTPRQFTDGDTTFLRSYANLIAAAVDRLRAVEEMRDEGERLRLALEAGELGRWELDLASGTLTTSQRASDIFGHSGSPATWTYDNLLSQILPEDREPVRAAQQQAADDNAEWHIEYRIRHAANGETRWIEERGRTIASRIVTSSRPAHLLGTVADVTVRKANEEALQRSNEVLASNVADLKEVQHRQQLLLTELQHRSRNLLALVQSINQRTLLRSQTLEEFQSESEGRLAALSRVQSLSQGSQETLDLRQLVEAELAAYSGDGAAQVTVAGPSVQLNAKTAQVLALALHELTTNAVKYGALKQAHGCLTVTWEVKNHGTRRLVLNWQERGVTMQEVTNPGVKGYGSELIERALPYQLKAETRLAFGADGIACSITVPIDVATAKVWQIQAAPKRVPAEAKVGPAAVLHNRHLLVVEDDYLIAEALTAALEAMGATVTGPVGSVEEALRLVETGGALDGAVLDIDLGDEQVYPVADALKAHGIPFVFNTGFDAWVVPAAYADVPRIEKPVTMSRLALALSKQQQH